MSDVAATNCGCDCGCGCQSGGNGCNIIWLILILCCCGGNGFGGCFGNNGCGNGCGYDIIWILLLLCCCGGRIKPDVVLYEEGLDDRTIQKSIDYIRNADMLIIGGTSLVVYPAAGLIDYYRGSKLVLINKSVTSRDSQADLVISDSIGKVLGAVVE